MTKSAIPKFILYGPTNQLIMSFGVEFHLELIPNRGSMNDVKGGGRINVQDQEKKVLFYAQSTDFGPCDKHDLIMAIKTTHLPAKWKGYKVFYAAPNVIEIDKAWEIAEQVHEINY